MSQGVSHLNAAVTDRSANSLTETEAWPWLERF